MLSSKPASKFRWQIKKKSFAARALYQKRLVTLFNGLFIRKELLTNGRSRVIALYWLTIELRYDGLYFHLAEVLNNSS